MWGGDAADADAYGLIRIQTLKTTAALRDRQAMALEAGLLDAAPEPEPLEPEDVVSVAPRYDLDALLDGPPTEPADVTLDALLNGPRDDDAEHGGREPAATQRDHGHTDDDDGGSHRGLLFFDTRGANANASAGNAVTLQMRQELEALLKSGRDGTANGGSASHRDVVAAANDRAPAPHRDGRASLPSDIDDLL